MIVVLVERNHNRVRKINRLRRTFLHFWLHMCINSIFVAVVACVTVWNVI